MPRSKLTNTKSASPYSRPPPVHIAVIETQDVAHILSWRFAESREVTPMVTCTNRVAIITDGSSVTTFTLFKEFASIIVEGAALVMSRFSIRGETCPFGIGQLHLR